MHETYSICKNNPLLRCLFDLVHIKPFHVLLYVTAAGVPDIVNWYMNHTKPHLLMLYYLYVYYHIKSPLISGAEE